MSTKREGKSHKTGKITEKKRERSEKKKTIKQMMSSKGVKDKD